MLDVCCILGDRIGNSIHVGEKEAKGLESYKNEFKYATMEGGSPLEFFFFFLPNMTTSPGKGMTRCLGIGGQRHQNVQSAIKK